MTINAFNIIVVVLMYYLCSSTRDINAAPMDNNNNSVLNDIKKNPDVCKAGSPFYDSNYAKICNNVKFPVVNATINPNDSQLFICLGLYDRILRLCHLDSMRINKNSSLPTETSIFDNEMKKKLPHNIHDINDFCVKWSNKYPPIYTKIKIYNLQFEEKMKNYISCLKICTDEQANFIPLCSTLAVMDKMSELTGVPLDDQRKKSDVLASKVEATELNMPLQNSHLVSANIEASNKNIADQKPAANTHLAGDSSAKSTQNVPKDSAIAQNLNQKKEAVNTKDISQSVSSLGIKSNQPVPESNTEVDDSITKTNIPVSAPSATAKIASNGDTENKEKPRTEVQTEQDKIDKSLQTNKIDMKINAKDAPAPSSDGPDNQGTSGEEIPDSTGAVLEGPKTDVISEHTQEDPDDQFQDPEPAEAIDSLLPDEDPDRNSFQQSEKHGYSPRMPSIPNDDDSHFFGYLTVIGVICISGYVGYHHKQKILAMLLEGRRSRGGRNRRRPSTANYRKLDCTLEEAVTSQCNSNVTHVIY